MYMPPKLFVCNEKNKGKRTQGEGLETRIVSLLYDGCLDNITLLPNTESKGMHLC
jgi:hypothetical protein